MRSVPHFVMFFAALSITAAVALAGDDAAGHKDYQVARVLKVGGDGRWDYLTYDAASKRLFIPRSTHTQIVNAEDGKILGDLKNTAGVHGVALVPELGRGFTTNGNDATLTVFDTKTYDVIGTVAVGKGPDGILYDPASKRILAMCGRGAEASVIDPAAAPGSSAAVHIPLGGKPESSASDGKGRVFVSLEDKDSVGVIDTKTMKLIATWKIDGGEAPSGLSIDIAHHRIFCGCHNQKMAILDTESGKTLATVPIGKGVDYCAFDPGTNEAFASCGDGTLTVAKETSPGKFQAVQTVKTRNGCKTMALDPTTHTIYLPTAELEEKAGEKRPVPKADSFMIVVVTWGAN